MLDDFDRRILDLLQTDADTPVMDIAAQICLSASACSRRITRLRTEGYIAHRVALLDRTRMKLPTTVFVMVKTSQHSSNWIEVFRTAVSQIPEITEVYRLTGTIDYIMKLVLPTVEHYDVVYKALVSKIEMFEMSAYISMETIKLETRVPTGYA